MAAARTRPARTAKQVLTDLFWALLNSQEFMFNH